MRRNVLEVKDLVRNYRKSVIKESEEDVKVLKESASKLQKVNLLESWENPDVVRQRCLRHSE